MPAIGKPEFKWDVPCLEEELIRWESVVLDNLKITRNGEDHKATWICGWIGDKGVKFLRKYK